MISPGISRRQRAPEFVCHAWPSLSVWVGNRLGGGEEDTERRRRRRCTRVLVDVSCNAGRSFITLGLPFAAFASKIAHSSGKSTSIQDLKPIYSEKRQIACETESKDVTVRFMEKEGECINAQMGVFQDQSSRCVRGNFIG